TPEIMERISKQFLDGIFFIPTLAAVEPVASLPIDNVAEHFKLMLLEDSGENYLPLYTDIASIKTLLDDTAKDHVVLEGISAARFTITQNYAGTVLLSTRLKNELMLPVKNLKGMLGIKT
ncbi:MAG: SseB family protein, partial [Cellvibrionaceae bacterium]|nr:SseB family protein [Cellvibrionaceae bacterium]